MPETVSPPTNPFIETLEALAEDVVAFAADHNIGEVSWKTNQPMENLDCVDIRLATETDDTLAPVWGDTYRMVVRKRYHGCNMIRLVNLSNPDDDHTIVASVNTIVALISY